MGLRRCAASRRPVKARSQEYRIHLLLCIPARGGLSRFVQGTYYTPLPPPVNHTAPTARRTKPVKQTTNGIA